MKRYISVVIMIIMIMVFAGCNDQTASNTPTTPQKKPALNSLAGIELNPPSLSAAITDVLIGREQFIKGGLNREQYLWDYYFPNACETLDVDRVNIAFVDMDQDGNDEIVFEMIDWLVLREENGKVYGYSFSFRQMDRIYADGTFSPLSTVTDGGTVYRIEFLEDGKYKLHVLCKQEYVDGETLNYVGDDQVSDAEFEQIYASHVNSGSVDWRSFDQIAPYDVCYKDGIYSLYSLVGYRVDVEFEKEYESGNMPKLDPSFKADSYEFSCMLTELTNGRNNPKTSDYYFSFVDLNQDGALELLFYRCDGVVHAIFTVVDGMPRMVDAFGSERMAKITESGEIMIYTNKGSDLAVSVVKLTSNSTEHQILEQFGSKCSEDTKIEYYQIVDGREIVIDQQQFHELEGRDLFSIQFPVPIPFVNDYHHTHININSNGAG